MYKAYQIYFITAGKSGTIHIIEKEENLDSRMKEFGGTALVQRRTSEEMRGPNLDRYTTTSYTTREISLDTVKLSNLSALDFLNLLKMNNQ